MIPKEMKCPICGGKLYDQGTERAINARCLYGNDMKAMVRSYSCGTCGRDLDFTDPMTEDREDTYSDYWNEHQDELYQD